MQTFTQTFAASQTWVLNVPGKYFTTLGCTNPVNVRFYKGGKQLDLGQVSQLLAGLEVTLGNIEDPTAAFDRVEVDVTGPDTVQVGIGNGQARYNRSQGNVSITGIAAGQTIIARPEGHTGFFNDQSAITANTPIQVFAPAANVNGAILLDAAINWRDSVGAVNTQVFLSKVSAPASHTDGAAYVRATYDKTLGTASSGTAIMDGPQFVPAGQGLYFIGNGTIAASAENHRHCRYKLL